VATNISIDPAIPLKLGCLQLNGCRVAPSPAALGKILDDVANGAQERFSNAALAEHPVVASVRRLFKSTGIDPSRYRPSSEALIRRILKGQGLSHINCVVDINNICSIESLFPLGVYDQARINGDVVVRLGSQGETYRGIGKEINVTGKLVAADRQGAFGSPVTDSVRTKISEDTHRALVLLYAPAGAEDREILDTLTRFADLAHEYAGAVRPPDAGYII
jgi:DNA/RNA-binding domain of Phe-tRNA-synthetase-like protein